VSAAAPAPRRPQIAYTLTVRFGYRVEQIQVYEVGTAPGLLPLLDAAAQTGGGPTQLEVITNGEARRSC
jgi:hypothetical protein